MPPEPSLSTPNHLAVLLIERDTGRPIEGIAFSAVAEYLPESQFHKGQFPLGVLATDHVGYLSFDLNPLELMGEKDLESIKGINGLRALWIYPMFDRGLALDVIKVGQLSKEVIFVSMEIAHSEIRNVIPKQMPSMQNPSLADWHISPGSFTINPRLMIGANSCENIVPSNIATQEFRFRQVVRRDLNPPIITSRSNDESIYTTTFNGFVYEYATKWHPIGHALGQIVYSLPLAPCESVNIAVIDWSRKDAASREEDLVVREQLLHNLHRDRSIEETIQASLREWQRGGSVMGGAAGSYMGISAAIGGGYSTSSGDRDLQSNTTQQLSDNIVQASNSMRSLNSTIVVQSSQQEQEVIQTRTITNHNHCHALTILYYEIMRHYRVVTSWISKRPVLLIQYPVKDFVKFNTRDLDESHSLQFDEAGIIRHRLTLQSVLLDVSLLHCFDVIEKLACSRLDFKSSLGAETTDDFILDSFDVIIKTGNKATNAFPFIQIETNSGQKIECFHKPLLPDQTIDLALPLWVEDPRFLYDWVRTKGVYLPQGYRQKNTETIYTLIPQQPVRWNNISKVLINLLGYADRSEGWSNWAIENIVMKTSQRDNIWKLYDGPLPDGKTEVEVGPIPVILSVTPFREVIKSAEDSLSHEERCCIDKLLRHLNSNKVHYNRAIWLSEDPDSRAVRFDKITGDLLGRKDSLLNHIENRPLAVYGNLVAFPIKGSTETTIEDEQGNKEYVSVSTEKLISLPVRGIFAEGKLGNCNSCEELDITRFWDWQKSPCPEIAPEIAPITAISPSPLQPSLTPSNLPNPVVNIVNPPNAPDPTAMAGALSLLGRSEIFRDMSLGEEVSALLQKLASGTISMAQAQQAAKKIKSSSSEGSDSGGSSTSSTGRLSPSEQHDQMQVIDNAKDKGLITDAQSKELAGDVLKNAIFESPSDTTLGTSTTKWPYLDRDTVYNRIEELKNSPNKIDQAILGLCNAAAFFHHIIQRNPDNFYTFAMVLYGMGWSYLGKWKITAGSKLLNTDYNALSKRSAGMPPQADWMIMAALRDSENWIFNYTGTSDELRTEAERSTIEEQKGWYENTGFYSSVKLTFGNNLATIYTIKKTPTNHIAFWINTKMIGYPKDGSHIITLEKPMIIDDAAKTITFEYWTWAKEIEKITVSIDEFRKYFGGYIEATF